MRLVQGQNTVETMTLALILLLFSPSFSTGSGDKNKTNMLEMHNGKLHTVKGKPPLNSDKKAPVSTDGEDYAETVSICNLPEWQDHKKCETKWITRMKAIIEDTADDEGGDDRGGTDYAEAVNIWDSPKLQGWRGISLFCLD